MLACQARRTGPRLAILAQAARCDNLRLTRPPPRQLRESSDDLEAAQTRQRQPSWRATLAGQTSRELPHPFLDCLLTQFLPTISELVVNRPPTFKPTRRESDFRGRIGLRTFVVLASFPVAFPVGLARDLPRRRGAASPARLTLRPLSYVFERGRPGTLGVAPLLDGTPTLLLVRVRLGRSREDGIHGGLRDDRAA